VPVRIVRGRANTIEQDRERITRLLETVRERRQSAVRVWAPHRQVAFGRRDTRMEGYERARRLCREFGFQPRVRSVGGRAVAYTGSTLAFASLEPVADARSGLDDRYETVISAIASALADLGVETTRGEPPGSFCPGAHSLSADGKVVGIAQRVRKDVAMTAGIAITSEREEITTVLGAVYDALDVPFEPESVGSIERSAQRPLTPDRIRTVIEDALLGERSREIHRA
jgi:lipoate-protein ligase A